MEGSEICGQIIQEGLYWLIGKGKKVNLWNDNIMGKNPINDYFEYTELMEWLKNNDIQTLFDPLEWDENGNWTK